MSFSIFVDAKLSRTTGNNRRKVECFISPFYDIKSRRAAISRRYFEMSKLKCASFFAGVGGIDMGFEQTKFFKTIYANEFDEYPVKTYEKNFKIKVDCRDINFVKASEIPDFDVMLAGFPCQAFSVAGY